MKNKFFYTLCAIVILFIFIPFISLNSYELGYSIDKSFDNFNFIIIIEFIISFFFHENIFQSTTTRSLLFYILTKIYKIVLGTVFSFLICCGLLSGLLLSINSYIGRSEKISLKTEVLSSESKKSKIGIKHYYIKVKIPNESRIVELKVDRPYYLGEIYQSQLYKGSLGMYYN